MGNCFNKSAAEELEDISFINLNSINIKERDYFGRVKGSTQVAFKGTQPKVHISDNLKVGGFSFLLSGCVLPGQDPRDMIDKECQDLLFYCQKESSLLAVLFDGHGKEGLKVVEFCKEFMLSHFQEKHQEFHSSPEESIANMVSECDEAIRGKEGVDCAVSGTTAVIIYINENGMHIGSVGDSRGLLGTLPKPGEELPVHTHDKKNSYKRVVNPPRKIKPLPLTIDQKPNHLEELERIQNSGGKVQQLTDERGNKVGPFRVWRKNGNLPGLAMSRSIGDSIAKEVGVIPTPIYHEFPFFPNKDQFIIAASDGVWDVMDNVEAVNFVEKFRSRCIKKAGQLVYPIRPLTTTIAHLLSEEARYRWFGICEEEDVMIDDISVLVIELSSVEPSVSIPEFEDERRTSRLTSVKNIEEANLNVPNALRADPVRGSFVPAKEPQKRVARNDPARGSDVVIESAEGPHEDPTLDEIPFVEDAPLVQEEEKK